VAAAMANQWGRFGWVALFGNYTSALGATIEPFSALTAAPSVAFVFLISPDTLSKC
jgi:hypothetical protein